MNENIKALLAQLNKELAPEFEIIRLLGEGKVARVVLARESALRRMVAIKVLRPELANEEVTKLRFAREAQSAARISHPNVTSVYQVGKLSDDTPFLVMEYVKGVNLAERLEQIGALPPTEARRVIHELASALEQAHRRGIVHRDVGLRNVLWNSETGQAILTDFGLAAVEPSPDHGTQALTRPGEVITGDMTCASPEQLRGETVSGASDVYALGALGYFLLTGSGPFQGKTAVQLAMQHMEAAPPELPEGSGIPRRLARLLHSCLAKEPMHRPTARDVARSTSEEDEHGSPVARETGNGLWADFRSRRIVQVMGTYTVGAWALLQIPAQLEEQALVPEVTYDVSLGLVVVGWFAAAILGWFHGEKGRQDVSKLEIVLLVLVAAAGVVVTMNILSV